MSSNRPTSEVRSAAAALLADARLPSSAVLPLARLVALDELVNDWFLFHVKEHGSDEEVMRVLETTDRCGRDCVDLLGRIEGDSLEWSRLSGQLEALADELRALLPESERQGF